MFQVFLRHRVDIHVLFVFIFTVFYNILLHMLRNAVMRSPRFDSVALYGTVGSAGCDNYVDCSVHVLVSNNGLLIN